MLVKKSVHGDRWKLLAVEWAIIKKAYVSKEQLYTSYFFIWDFFAKLFVNMYMTYACTFSHVPRVQVIEINIILYICTLMVILI